MARRYVRRVPVPCKWCGDSFTPYTEAVVHCSRACATQSRIAVRVMRVCEVCGVEFHRQSRGDRDKGRCCSRECGWELGRREGAIQRARTEAVRQERRLYAEWSARAARQARERKRQASLDGRPCRHCGAPIIGRLWKRTCSDACSLEVRRQVRAKPKRKTEAAKRRKRVWRVRRKAAERGARVESVDPIAVFERDAWRCHLCGRKTLKARRGTYHPKAPELDHIVPLSQGGEHSYRNTACSCRACNAKKSNGAGGQLLMFGTEIVAGAGRVKTPIGSPLGTCGGQNLSQNHINIPG